MGVFAHSLYFQPSCGWKRSIGFLGSLSHKAADLTEIQRKVREIACRKSPKPANQDPLPQLRAIGRSQGAIPTHSRVVLPSTTHIYAHDSESHSVHPKVTHITIPCDSEHSHS